MHLLFFGFEQIFQNQPSHVDFLLFLSSVCNPKAKENRT